MELPNSETVMSSNKDKHLVGGYLIQRTEPECDQKNSSTVKAQIFHNFWLAGFLWASDCFPSPECQILGLFYSCSIILYDISYDLMFVPPKQYYEVYPLRGDQAWRAPPSWVGLGPL